MSTLNTEQAQRIYTLARKVVHQQGTYISRSDISMFCGARLYIELKEDTGKLTILAFDEGGQPVEEPAFISYADGRVDAYQPGDWEAQLQALAEGSD